MAYQYNVRGEIETADNDIIEHRIQGNYGGITARL